MIVKPQQWAGEGAGAALNLAFETAFQLTKCFCNKQPPLRAPSPDSDSACSERCFAAWATSAPPTAKPLPCASAGTTHCKTPSLCEHPLRSPFHVPCTSQLMQHFLYTFGFFFLKAAPAWQSRENPLHGYADLYLLVLILAFFHQRKAKRFHIKGLCEVAAQFAHITAT